jgi:CheY-like chemotaxis protein
MRPSDFRGKRSDDPDFGDCCGAADQTIVVKSLPCNCVSVGAVGAIYLTGTVYADWRAPITPLYNSCASQAHARVAFPASHCNSGHGFCVPRDLEIAVIDDDESFRIALVESLSSLGYGTSGYMSAEEYIDAIGTTSFDCIVTDIHMPGMSGLDLMKWLTSQGHATPVLLITARLDSNVEAKAIAAKAVCLLKKPFEINELIECIEGAVKS